MCNIQIFYFCITLHFALVISASGTSGEYLMIEDHEMDTEFLMKADEPTITSSYMKCKNNRDCKTLAIDEDVHYVMKSKKTSLEGNNKDITKRKVSLLTAIDDRVIFKDEMSENKSSSQGRQSAANRKHSNCKPPCGKNTNCVQYNGKYECTCICGFSKQGLHCKRDDYSGSQQSDEMTVFAEKCVLRRNNLIKIFESFQRVFHISVDVYINQLNTEWENAVYFGTKDKKGPAVSFGWNSENRARTIEVCTFKKNANGTNLCYTLSAYKSNQWINIEYTQIKESEGLFIISIKLDGREMINTKVNRYPKMRDLPLYISSPYMNPFTGFIKNFKITKSKKAMKKQGLQT